MREVTGDVSIIVNKDNTTIEIRDKISGVIVARAMLTPEQFCNALSRTMNIDCEIEVGAVERIGQIRKYKEVIVELPEDFTRHHDERRILQDEQIRQKAQDQVSGWWIVSGYLGSRESFFTKDGKKYAKLSAIRYVTPTEQELEEYKREKLMLD